MRHIAPQVKLNVSAADVVPILLAVIQEHRNAATRDKLTYALFNLVKKPTAGQRHLIADSCADLAGRIGASRTAEELLPQCWEQVPCLCRLACLCATCKVLVFVPAWQVPTTVARLCCLAWLCGPHGCLRLSQHGTNPTVAGRVDVIGKQGQLSRNKFLHLRLFAWWPTG